jgi:hypothetical protein
VVRIDPDPRYPPMNHTPEGANPFDL